MKGLLCTTDVVKAILNNTKTQTRRPCKDQTAKQYQYVENTEVCPRNLKARKYTGWAKDCGFSFLLPTKPPSKVGGILYCRETWCPRVEDWRTVEGGIWYKAGISELDRKLMNKRNRVWKPNIHMQKWAARIFLQVMEVKCVLEDGIWYWVETRKRIERPTQ